MGKEKWYAIPPYTTNGTPSGVNWEIHNEKGELVASFEDREECEKIVELFNNQKNKAMDELEKKLEKFYNSNPDKETRKLVEELVERLSYSMGEAAKLHNMNQKT